MKGRSRMTKLAQFMFEVGSLRKIARSHRQVFLTDDLSDNIATHSYRVTWLGYFLAQAEKADILKVVTICLLHDLPESRSGDQNWIHKRYVKVFEDEIIKEQFAGLPDSQELISLAEEYQTRTSRESQLAKDADVLDQMLLLKEYALRGNLEAASWHLDNKIKLLTSTTAKKLGRAIINTKPSDWWAQIWTEKRR